MAQQQATLTISGYVGSDPVNFSRNENAPACSLRIGSTSSYYHNEEKAWKERPTTWMTVKAYKSLASNVLKSVHKGDAIVVCGNLNTESWHKDGEDRSRVVLEATSIGHDLNRGISEFTKTSYARNRNVANTDSKNKDYSENGDSQNQNFAMKNPMSSKSNSSKSQSSIQDNSQENSQEDAEISDFGGQLDEEQYNDIEGGANDF
ncbi:single-stranded DNA-binding protein [Gardnerella vaginalis]|uniref:single-stranded DNA-binding protein n=1 Tax=Gardnerella vaginalis TaxID=2702 RepID=UPI0039EFECDD